MEFLGDIFPSKKVSIFNDFIFSFLLIISKPFDIFIFSNKDNLSGGLSNFIRLLLFSFFKSIRDGKFINSPIFFGIVFFVFQF